MLSGFAVELGLTDQVVDLRVDRVAGQIRAAMSESVASFADIAGSNSSIGSTQRLHEARSIALKPEFVGTTLEHRSATMATRHCGLDETN